MTEDVLRTLGYATTRASATACGRGGLPSGLAQVPFVWPCVDGFYYLRADPLTPAEVRDRWLASARAWSRSGGLFLLICHAFITGRRRRRASRRSRP